MRLNLFRSTSSRAAPNCIFRCQAKVNPLTGKITRVVDIAEAPWRVIGLALAPIASILVVMAELTIFRR